ncbi:MAG: transposase [Roseobacter sp.]|jgi:transposase-like protein
MREDTITALPDPNGFSADPLTDLIRSGARQLIEQALEAELATLMAAFSGERLEDGRARLMRHGHLPERDVMTGIGPVPVKVPRVRDRGAGEDKISFTPSILPRYLRKARSIEELLPWLYLKGVSTGDFTEALEALLGPNAKGLSAKTMNVLNAMPKSVQVKAKAHLHDIWQAETKAKANVAFDFFVETYGVKWDKAVAKLVKDRDALLTFYDYPAEQWKHIRTSNPIESTFATVRHRTKRTKGCLSRKTGLAMVFKLMMSAQKKWRKLNGRNRLPEIIQEVQFRDGLRHVQAAA